MKEFDWQVKCDVFMVSMATWRIEYNLWLACHHVQYSPQIDTHTQKNWHDFTAQYHRYHSLSAFCFCLCFPITSFFKKIKVEKKNPTNNKLQTGLIEEVVVVHSNAGDEWKSHPPRPCTITLVTADWYGSDSSWLISQIKIIETMKLFSAKLLGPN